MKTTTFFLPSAIVSIRELLYTKKMRLRLQKFDANAMKPFSISLLLGRRNTGKSTLMRDLLYHMRDHSDVCICMTPTESAAQFFREITPKSFVYDSGLDLAMLESLMTIQREFARTGKRVRRVTLVLDDCSCDASALRSNVISDLFRNGRHQKITVIITSQYATDLGPGLRSQVDYVFCMRDPSVANKKRLHSFFAGAIESYHSFSNVFDIVTSNYGVFVVNNTAIDSDVETNTYWYRASLDIPQFQLTDKVYYKIEKKQGRRDTIDVAVASSQKPPASGGVILDSPATIGAS